MVFQLMLSKPNGRPNVDANAASPKAPKLIVEVFSGKSFKPLFNRVF
jgi:hypothetical protein